MTNTFKRAWILPALLASAGIALFLAIAPARAEETEATAESMSEISFAGQLIELSSTDLPTTIVVRKSSESGTKDYTVSVTAETALRPAEFKMSDWITGDFLAVSGRLNENTGVVSAAKIQNVSLNPFEHKSLNGWVTAVNASAMTLTVKWQDKEHVVKVDADTKMVVGGKNPAALSDFLVGDRVRLRLTRRDGAEVARIVVALRRGDDIFLKARTRPFNGVLETLDAAGSTLTIRLHGNAELRPNDVNNLVGVEGELITVTYDESTKIVRRYKGEASIDELTPGDELFIVGRVGDDGVVAAKMIKDNSIFKRGIARQLGKVTAVDVANNKIKADVLVRKDLKAMTFTAQNQMQEDAAAELRARMLSGEAWTVTYTDATKFMRNGRAADENAVKVGDVIRVIGVANATTKTVAATHIFAAGEDFKPLVRERPIKEIVKQRMKVAEGKLKVEDIVEAQEPEDAIEADEHDDENDDENETVESEHGDEDEAGETEGDDNEGMEM